MWWRAPSPAVPSMLELEVTLPLAHYELEVRCTFADRVTAIVGPSGSGKTSLLETIAGLRPRARGAIKIDGADVANLPPEKRRIAYVPQDVALFPHLTARDHDSFASNH